MSAEIGWVQAERLRIVESGLAAGDAVIVDGIAKLQPGGAIALGGAAPPGPGAAPAPAGQAPAKDAAPAKDGVKAPSPKS